jgi:hypothetical protein
MLDGKRITRRRWTPAEDQVIRDQYGNMSAAETGQLIDRTENAVWDRARFLGLDKRDIPPAWTAAELDELRRCYATDRPSAIARRIGRTTSAVSQQAAVLGLASRKTLISAQTVHGYFSDLATAEQAYILGLLAADGNISSSHPRVQLGLQAKDAHLVEWVRDRLNPSMALSVRPDGHAVLMITSGQMTADLALHGVIPRKSMTLPWPEHLGPLLRPFLLGYFDGDGSACMTKGGTLPNWSVCSGSEIFLVAMRAYIAGETGVVMQKVQHRPRSGLYQVMTSGWRAVKINDWLHQDGLGLERKRFRGSDADHHRSRIGRR